MGKVVAAARAAATARAKTAAVMAE